VYLQCNSVHSKKITKLHQQHQGVIRGAWGPGSQASHQKGASHQTLHKLLADRYGCFGCLSTLSPEELLTAAKTLVECYPNDLQDNSFVDELCHFAMFAEIFKDDKPGNLSTELFFVQTDY